MITTLAVQIYSLREHGTLPERLDMVKAAGFPAVEITAGMYETPEASRDLLAARGLAAPAGHIPLAAMRERFDATLAAARIIGTTGLIVPSISPTRPTDADGWRAAGAELGSYAERLADLGFAFGFHNHHWEVEPLPDGSLPLDLLLDAGAPKGLKWQVDVAWLVRGNDDVVARLERHGDLLHSVHVKDIAPQGEAVDEDGWADVGHGVMDWATYWEITTRHTNLMIAEHDKPSDPVRFLTRSHASMARFAGGAQ